MRIFSEIRTQIIAVLQDMAVAGEIAPDQNFNAVRLDLPRDAGFGHMTCNAALTLMPGAGQDPRALASQLAARLGQDQSIDQIQIAGPGFLNIQLKPEIWQALVIEILRQGQRFGSDVQTFEVPVAIRWDYGGQGAQAELSLARGVATGAALARLLRWGGCAVDVVAEQAWSRELAALLPSEPSPLKNNDGRKAITFVCGDPTFTKQRIANTPETQIHKVKRCLPVQMRGFDTPNLHSLIGALGRSAAGVALGARRCDLSMILDHVELRDNSYANPLYSMQYAHVRAVQIQNSDADTATLMPTLDGLAAITAPEQLRLIAMLGQWPEVVDLATAQAEPDRITRYLSKLAKQFHTLCDPVRLGGTSLQNLPPLAKKSLAGAVAVVINSGLGILGLERADEMR